MCGFVCLWNIDDEELAQAMIARIAHRRPGCHPQVVAAPANRAGHHGACQAFHHWTGQRRPAESLPEWTICFVVNGEIYNHADLRALISGPQRPPSHAPGAQRQRISTQRLCKTLFARRERREIALRICAARRPCYSPFQSAPWLLASRVTHTSPKRPPDTARPSQPPLYKMARAIAAEGVGAHF